MSAVHVKRQDGYRGDGYYDTWWYSDTAIILKWAILAGIVILFLVFFVGSYLHARRRMRKGNPPLPYHRWLVPRAQRARFEPHLAHPDRHAFYQSHQSPYGQAYTMYPVPPPAYNPDFAPPPHYQPPIGASKTDPSQAYNRGMPAAGESSMAGQQVGVTPAAASTSTPPVQAHGTGSTNPYR